MQHIKTISLGGNLADIDLQMLSNVRTGGTDFSAALGLMARLSAEGHQVGINTDKVIFVTDGEPLPSCRELVGTPNWTDTGLGHETHGTVRVDSGDDDEMREYFARLWAECHRDTGAGTAG